MHEFIWLIEVVEEDEENVRGTLRKYTIEFALIKREIKYLFKLVTCFVLESHSVYWKHKEGWSLRREKEKHEVNSGCDIGDQLMLCNHRRTDGDAEKREKRKSNEEFNGFNVLRMWDDYQVRHPNNVTYSRRFYLDNFHVGACDNHVEFDRELHDWPYLHEPNDEQR